MELRFRGALAALAVLVSATVAAAQAQPRAGRFNPPYLAEMPPVDRVLREITAPDPRDAVAHQMGAFEQLGEVIAELSGGRVAIGQQTPDEERIMAEYRNARSQVQWTLVKTPQDEALLPALRRFDEDPALREEIVKRFLSPALAAQSTAVSQQIQANRNAMRQRQAANGGVPDAFGGSAARPTDGPQVEQAVSKELIGKYGRWSTATEHFITNNVTGSRLMVLDLRWNLPGLRVEYVPASAESISKGTVRIETDPIYQRRQEAAKEAAKPKL